MQSNTKNILFGERKRTRAKRIFSLQCVNPPQTWGGLEHHCANLPHCFKDIVLNFLHVAVLNVGLLRVWVHTPILWSHTYPFGHTLIALVIHPSYWSHTHPTGHTPILLFTHPSHWLYTHHTGHTPILRVTYPSWWSHTHPTGHTPILLVTHPSYWSHNHLNSHTPILIVTHPS